MSRAAHPQPPRLVKQKPFICGKTNAAGEVCTYAPRHQRSRCSWRHFQPPWAGAAMLGVGTPAPPFTGTPQYPTAAKVRADRADLRRLRAEEK